MNLANLKIYLLIPLALFFLASANYISSSIKKPTIEISKQEAALNINSDFLILFSSGYKRLITDLYWISTLLDSDHDHYKNKDLNSWMYLRFKTMTRLDPNFEMAYVFGGKYLSIIKDDLLGAKDILDDGLIRFPENYQIAFSAAYLYAFELYDSQRGAELYTNLLKFPQAPYYTKSIIAKLQYSQSNDLQETFNLLYEFYKSEPEDSPLKKKFAGDLYAIKAEIDLECLNSNRGNCSKVDFFNAPYIFNGSEYISQKKFIKFKLHKRDSNKKSN